MIKVYDLAGRVLREGGETVLGLKDLSTHACYMIHGVLSPGDPPRLFRPGPGHEEIIMATSGSIKVEGASGFQTLQPGQAIYLKGEESLQAVTAGPAEARYVGAGGHSEGGHHHDH
jgi:hypothetical protein